MRKPTGLLLVVLGLQLGLVEAQGQKPQPPTPPATPPGRGTPAPPQTRRPERQQPRIIFLSGSVEYTDGSSVTEPLLVELRCNGSPRSQVWSSVNGRFGFQLGGAHEFSSFDVSMSRVALGPPGSATDQTLDGSDPFATSDRTRPINLSGCEIRLAHGGYRARAIRLGMRSPLDSPEVGTLVIERRDGVQGTLVSVKTLAAPKKARKAFQKASKELGKEKPDLEKAQEQLERALEIFPEFAEAWHLLGKIHGTREDWPGARQAFREALTQDPDFIPPYLALGQLELNQKQWPAASELLDRALELNPYAIQARFSSGVAHYYMDHLEQAEQAFEAVKTSNEASNYPGIHYALGLVLARRGKIPEAATELQVHLERFPNGEAAGQIQLQLEEWQRQGLLKP